MEEQLGKNVGQTNLLVFTNEHGKNVLDKIEEDAGLIHGSEDVASDDEISGVFSSDNDYGRVAESTIHEAGSNDGNVEETIWDSGEGTELDIAHKGQQLPNTGVDDQKHEEDCDENQGEDVGEVPNAWSSVSNVESVSMSPMS